MHGMAAGKEQCINGSVTPLHPSLSLARPQGIVDWALDDIKPEEGWRRRQVRSGRHRGG